MGASGRWRASWPPAGPPASGAGKRNRVGAGGMAENPESADKPLKLRAHDPADMDVVAALLQDALVPLGDMTYLAKAKRFVMVANRFRRHGDASQQERPPAPPPHAAGENVYLAAGDAPTSAPVNTTPPFPTSRRGRQP